MRLALIQQHAGEDLQANVEAGLKAFEAAADQGADMVCFAELAFTPFYPQNPVRGPVRHLAEPIPGPITAAFSEAARIRGVAVVLNLFECDGDATYDTSPVIDASGELLGRTRMVHITDYQGFHEKGYYHPGDTGAQVFDLGFIKLGVAICYDRHFPEYMRALGMAGAELVVTPQAGAVGEWPEGLFEAEMRVAAFQNGYFTALCNRVGEEPRLTFAGGSFVVDPEGVVIARAPEGEDHILMAEIDREHVANSHAKRLFLPDRRPQLYGPWLSRP